MRTALLAVLVAVLAAAPWPALAAAGQGQPGEVVATLRVSTPSYRLDAAGLHVEGYAQDSRPGAPLLPVWSAVVELPAAGEWQISYDSPGSQLLVAPAPENPSGLECAAGECVDVTRPEGFASVAGNPSGLECAAGECAGVTRPEGFASVAPRLVDRPDPAIYQVDAFYPAAPVVAGPEQRQRGRRLLPVRVYPFQVNPVTGILRYSADIQVVVRVTPPGNGSLTPAEKAEAITTNLARSRVSDELGSLRLYTGQEGLYRLTYADLRDAGLPLETLDPASLAISYLGQPVDIQVTGAEDGRFDPGDLALFYAEPYRGRYMTRNVYRLSYGGSAPGSRMASRAVTPSGSEPLLTTITQTVHVEHDRVYYSTYDLPRDADHWFDNPLYANIATPTATLTYTLALDDLAPAGAAVLRAALHGGANQSATPDQSAALRLNGHPLGVFQWEGSSAALATATAPAGWLAETGNTVTLQAALTQLSGLAFYWVSPDWVELSYPARAEAEGDQIVIAGLPTTGQAAHVVLDGFSTGAARVYDVRDPRHPVQVATTWAEFLGNAWAVHFWDAWQASDPAPAYLAAAMNPTALHAPLAIEVDEPSSWRSPDHQADYIAIVHPLLWEAIDPLLARRAAEGLRVAKVNVQDVYDEFSAGRVDPEALRSFLSYAYNHWNGQMKAEECTIQNAEFRSQRGSACIAEGSAFSPAHEPPGYVLLVGDGHYDFKDAAGSGLPNLIPPYLLHIDPWLGETAADNRFVSVDGPDDYLPDMAVGRIPAKTPADVAAVVAKIAAYESEPAGDWQQRAVFVADDYANPAGNFHALSDVGRQALPANYGSQAVYYRMDPAHDSGAEMRGAIKQAFDGGALYLQWFGHASQFRWGSVSMFDILDPPALAGNARLPFTVHYGCWSGYFIGIRGSALYGNNEQSLGEALLLTPGRGAVADLSPSGQHVGSALLELERGMIQALFQQRTRRLGQAVDAAKGYYFANSTAWHDVIDTTILFGDPALRLRLPGQDKRLYLPLLAL